MLTPSEPGTERAAADMPDITAAIRRVLDACPADTITVADIQTGLAERATAIMLLLFAAANFLPLPPGSTMVTGIPLIFLSVKLLVGNGHVRLPWLGKRGISRTMLESIVAKLHLWEERAMRIVRPRMKALSGSLARRLIGAVTLLLAIILWLPIPLGNHLPALTIGLFAFGLIKRDGLFIIAGGISTVVSLVVVSGVIWAGVKAALLIAPKIFG